LNAPRFVNWSAGVERRLLASVHLQAEFIQKRGSQGFTFVNLGANQPGNSQNTLTLTNARRDRFDSLLVTLRYTLKGSYSVLGSYMRSSARSNAVIDFNFGSPLFSQQAGGPLAWDTPNHFLSWGFLPLVKKFDLAYSLEWRDGYPFSLVNQEQQLVGEPNSRRFPTYFSLNVHLERRFRLLGAQWALRAGSNNVTNRHNATGVNNNVDSPQFLTFGGLQHRVFTARIRLLGKK
jgi:hypothetical protein